MLSTLRRLAALPPVRTAIATGLVSVGLSMLARVAAAYRDAIEIARDELAGVALRSLVTPAPDPRAVADLEANGLPEGIGD